MTKVNQCIAEAAMIGSAYLGALVCSIVTFRFPALEQAHADKEIFKRSSISDRFCRHLPCILLASFQAPAAEIVQRDIAGGKMIVVSGNIDFGDDRRFASIAAQVRNGIVFFNSPGGSLDAAIQMGKIIRVMGLVTHVAESDICVSACALAWLGGSARLMSPSAKIGFHAAYIDKLGEKEVSSVGNAIVGGYLNGLGFSENAIAYVTSAPPDGVRWLTLDDAAKVGIEVKRGLEPQTDRSSQPVQNVTNLECVIKQASSIDSGDPIQKITVQLFLDDKSKIEKLGVVHHAKSGATYNRADQYINTKLIQNYDQSSFTWTGTSVRNRSKVMRGRIVKTLDMKWFYSEDLFDNGRLNYSMTSLCRVEGGASIISQPGSLQPNTNVSISSRLAALMPASEQSTCYGRVYDDAHLSAHPDQTVTSMLLGLKKPELSNPSQDTSRADFEFVIGLTLHGNNQLLVIGDECRLSEDGDSVTCGVACDGGSFRLVSAKQPGSMLLFLDRLRLTACGEEAKSVEVRAGKDDKTFRLG